LFRILILQFLRGDFQQNRPEAAENKGRSIDHRNVARILRGLMAYAETRDGKATGRWMGRVRLQGKPPFGPRAYDRKKDAEWYESYVRNEGKEPPAFATGSGGKTFADAAEAAKAAGGPNGLWLAGRDPSRDQRLQRCVDLIGHLDVEAVDLDAYELIIADLRKRPPGADKKGRTTISNCTIGKYLFMASGVLTYALSKRWRTIEKPKVPAAYRKGGKRKEILDEDEDEPFDTKGEAEDYEAYIHRHGREPDVIVAGKRLARPGKSLAEVYALAKAEGGPRGRDFPRPFIRTRRTVTAADLRT
jgi:hypothetical protein